MLPRQSRHWSQSQLESNALTGAGARLLRPDGLVKHLLRKPIALTADRVYGRSQDAAVCDRKLARGTSAPTAIVPSKLGKVGLDGLTQGEGFRCFSGSNAAVR